MASGESAEIAFGVRGWQGRGIESGCCSISVASASARRGQFEAEVLKRTGRCLQFSVCGLPITRNSDDTGRYPRPHCATTRKLDPQSTKCRARALLKSPRHLPRHHNPTSFRHSEQDAVLQFRIRWRAHHCAAMPALLGVCQRCLQAMLAKDLKAMVLTSSPDL